MLDSLEKRILVTLAYSLQFSQPLTTAELFLRLIGTSSKADFIIALANLVDNNILVKAKKYWFLSGAFSENLQHNLAASRLIREQYAAKKKLEIEPLLSFAKLCPWVEGIAITGSVAVGNAVEDDDVDLLIVAQQKRLWLVRLLFLTYATLKHKRRSFSGEEKNSWCFNLWLEPQRLKITQKKRSLYTAYEVLQADWVFDAHDTERRFLLENAWVEQYLPNFFSQKKHFKHIYKQKKQNTAVFSFIYTMCNAISYALQALYMSRHKTTENVGVSHAFFHPRDTGLRVRSQLIQLIWQAITFVPADIETVLKQLEKLKDYKKIVLVTGVFDIIHQQHSMFLSKARKLGTILVIGIESDGRVRQIKGEGRPIHSAADRVRNLANLHIAEFIFVLPEKFSSPADHVSLITKLRPSYLAVSSHTAHLEKKQAVLDLVEGSVVVVHQHDPSVSTTQLLAQQ